MNLYVDEFIRKALEEDLGVLGDITTDTIFDDTHKSEVVINFREEAVVGGINFAKRVFEIIDPNISFEILKPEGKVIKKAGNAAIIKGKTKSILRAERVALNIMQRVSGIATNTKKYAELLLPYGCKISDTRKTTPLFRYFEKYGVKIGGGINHRFGLYDSVMIKDNHIVAAGGIKSAIEKLKKNISHTTKIEVEVESYGEAKEALECGADIVMLDNIRGEELKKCVEMLKGKVIIEASGNLDITNIEEIAKAGVEVISSGALVYDAKNIDIGIDFIL